MIIKAKNIDEALYKTSKELLNAPEYFPRGRKTKELIQVKIEIENPLDCIIKNKARKLSLHYLDAEMKWYLSGDRSIDKIKDKASLWQQVADKEGNVNSNYGYIVFKKPLKNFEGSQYDWVIHSLNKDKDSRQALINFNESEYKDILTKDFVCTINTQYLIRENKLIGITNMRSNDLIYGFSYDFPFFSFLQNKIAKELNVDIGKNIHTAASMHVYERHFKMLENIVEEYERKN